MTTAEPDLGARLRALEAYEEIRLLAARYAHALDSRNIDELVGLFVEDVKTGDGGVGRGALADWGDTVLRSFTTTSHLIRNHIIDLVDEDHATGIVYCRPEDELPSCGLSCRCSTGTGASDGTAAGNSRAAASTPSTRPTSWRTRLRCRTGFTSRATRC